MAKFNALFFLALVLCSSLAHASRPVPKQAIDQAKTQHEGIEAEKAEVVEESCEGIGEDECLMRRTLAAHTDYIYTQKHNKP
ncbi:phytosulfokines 3 [Ziziphus jujuba]|uniref:Phytosulfokine n=1 Tax=Ziziphus jujuba TaxID=326968 RepID=A0ABM3ITV6_ZIZJJ|nr:phytosulfokines 3 [Ziziphus jujuba]